MSDTFLTKYVLSCMAATAAETATYPLDLTKTRLQIQGEGSSSYSNNTNGNTNNRNNSINGASTSKQQSAAAVHNTTHINNNAQSSHTTSSATSQHFKKQAKRGMFATASGIAREEGILRLWQGVSPALARHYVYTGVRIGIYEQLRENIFKKDEDGYFSIWKAMMCGVTAGGVAQFLASPADLIKVQMQMEGRRRLEGLPPRYTEQFRLQIIPAHQGGLTCSVKTLLFATPKERVKNMRHAGMSVIASSGVWGLWKGWIPNCQRAALVNMADLATYDQVKHLLLRKTSLDDNWLLHGMSSVCSGFAAAITSTPADVVKTRVMNQPTLPDGKGTLYKSSFDCLFQTISKEGFFALYKGFIPIWTRMGPWSLTFWVSYEEIRKFCGSSSF